MKIKSKASEVLEQAENDLRKLIVEAAQDGEYETVELVAAWASQLSAMHGKGLASSPKGSDPRSEQSESVQVSASILSERPSAKRSKKRRRGTARGYPKFVRSGDSLVKVAWSKSQKSEYKHKSPRCVLTQLVKSLSERLTDDSVVVSMEEILPLKGSEDTEIPDYQAYLCLAWLRSIGAVKQKGREGYTRSGNDDEIEGLVEGSWEKLPEDK